ncbi:LPS-assembly protein LptD [Oleidesulfovibrio sp.]|uniref:LPS-assembly protein LptD n=1 Tax=Oleidesulfovibrio sp. TaxID=2909707 RepID=UPI003A840962
MACLILASAVSAAANSIVITDDEQETVIWNLSADRVVTFSDSKMIEAYGNVALREGDDYLKADFIRYFGETEWVLLKGNVNVKMGRDVVEATEAEFDLKNRVGWLRNGSVFMDGPHVYFTGERVKKDFGDSYRFRNAKITACDGDSPAWSISAREATIELEGYSQLWHTSMQVKNQDVLYAPYAILPAKKKRQTGFLLPEVGQSSKRGMYYNQPFFWAIDDTTDMTFNAYWMEMRGVMTGVEFRQHATEDEKSWFRADYLKDARKDSTEEDEPGGLGDDGLIRNNDDRFWVRGMFDANLPDPRWKVKGTLDYVSDQNYLREFSSGMSGFDRSQSDFEDIFGRSLSSEAQNRTSEVLLSREWERVGLGISGKYTQNINVGNGNLTSKSDNTVQTLPQIDFFLFKSNLIEDSPIPVEIQATAQAVNYLRHNGTTGARFEIAPQVSIPLSGRYGSIISTFGVRHTEYSTDHKEPDGVNVLSATGTSRTIPSMNISAFTEVARTFNLAGQDPVAGMQAGDTRWTMLRHSLQPRVSYDNTANVDQDDNPYYTVHDRILARNEITYSLTNLFTRKRLSVSAASEEEGGGLVQRYDYSDFLRVRLQQSYDIREADRTEQLDKYETRPFSDIEAEVTMNFDSYAWLTSRTFWSPYLSKMTRHEHTLNLSYSDWVKFHTTFDFREAVDEYKRKETETDDKLSSMDSQLDLKLWGPWSVALNYEVDLDKGKDIEKGIDVTYSHQCFDFMVGYSKDGVEDEFSFWLALPGISF